MTTFCFRHAEHLLASCDSRAHVVGSLETGDEALLVRAHLIRNAERTIDVQTFIWANDESGRYVVYELLKAAQRGIKIRILVDGWVIIGNPQLISYLSIAHENISVKHYNPPAERIRPSTLDLVTMALTDFSVINHRMHNKVFTVDNRVTIVGGRNYQNDYYDRSEGRNFRDREVIVFGAAAAEATNAFDAFWDSVRALKGERLKDFSDHVADCPYGEEPSFELGSLFDELNDRASDDRFMKDYFNEKLHAVPEVCFVTDLPQSYEDPLNPTVRAMVDFFAGAESELLLQTPYLVLDPIHFETLQLLRDTRNGLKMRVSTNSLASTDNVIAYAHSSRERVQYLAELRLEIFELKPIPQDVKHLLGFHRRLAHLPETDFARALEQSNGSAPKFSLCCHAKALVRDNRDVWIGSSNIDPRSARVNSENAFIVYDESFARRIAAEIERDIAPKNSWTMGFAEDAPALSALREMLLAIIPSEQAEAEQFLRFAEDFELKPGSTIVPFYDPAFQQNYESVGPFPRVQGSSLEIQVRLISLLPEATKVLV